MMTLGYPESFGRESPVVGWRSVRGTICHRSDAEGFGMELFGGRAYRRGPWKAVAMAEPWGANDWQLFNLDDDPAERRDRSADRADIRRELIAAWDQYARDNNVILPNRTPFDGATEQLPPRPPVDDDWPPGQEKNHAGDGSNPQLLFGPVPERCK